MKRISKLFVIMLVTALVGHSFYIYRFFQDGTIFTGPNDGLEQMLPMQLYLYEKWSQGKWFYDIDFGLGGDYYTDLAYYYSTNVIFFFNMLIVKFLSLFMDLKTDTITFWAKNAFFISIIKSAIAGMFSYLYLRTTRISKSMSVLFAYLFITSAIYFRFTLYWSFFSDIFIFLPMLLFGIERFIQYKDRKWFIIAVTLSLINNFYFAYYQLLFGVIYFVIRNIWQSEYDVVSRSKQWLNLIIMTLLSVGMSSFAFYYGVRGFLSNSRATYDSKISLFSPFDQHANIFYDNYLVIVLFIALQAIVTFKFYDKYFYRLFALMTLALMFLSFTPFIDAVFNGFSAPQKRWHYLITFFSSGLIAMYYYRFKEVSIQNYLYSLILPSIILILSAKYINKSVEWLYIVPIIMIVGLFVLLFKQNKLLMPIMIALVVILNWDIVKVHNQLDNYHPDINKRAKMSYIKSSVYDSDLQRAIIQDLNKKLKPGERIDFRVLEQDNTPMYQGFNGVSLYSSIFDGRLIDFYYYDLMINLREESISRYSTFQSRSNLHSLFNVKYLVRKDYQTDIPANFKLIKTEGKYKIYENELPLPTVYVTDTVFNKDKLTTPIDREHAMLEGVVLEGAGKQIKQSKNLLKQSDIKLYNATKNGDKLKVNAGSGGLIITVDKPNMDYYVDIHSTLIGQEKNHQINVNGYANNRLFKSSKYRTHQDHLLYRVRPTTKKILIGLSESEYLFKINGLYAEDYSTLKRAATQTYDDYIFKEDGPSMSVTINATKDGTLVLPITYREGLKAKIDGKRVDIFSANYIHSAVNIKKGKHDIEISYLPPYFSTMVLLSLISLALTIFYLKRRKGL